MKTTRETNNRQQSLDEIQLCVRVWRACGISWPEPGSACVLGGGSIAKQMKADGVWEDGWMKHRVLVFVNLLKKLLLERPHGRDSRVLLLHCVERQAALLRLDLLDLANLAVVLPHLRGYRAPR